MKIKKISKKKATRACTRNHLKNFVSCKRSQEEMVGFALIIIIVAVIIIVFLGFSLRSSRKETIESYEAESFIQASLQFTTDCRDYFEPVSIQKLIFDCYEKEQCTDGKETCDVLNSTLTEMLEESWKIGEDAPVKGYEFKIIVNPEETPEKMLEIKQGNVTSNSKGASQSFSKGGNSIEVLFTVYY